MSDSNCCSAPVSYAAAEEDSTSGLVIKVFDDSDKVYFFMVAHNVACKTLSKTFLKL